MRDIRHLTVCIAHLIYQNTNKLIVKYVQKWTKELKSITTIRSCLWLARCLNVSARSTLIRLSKIWTNCSQKAIKMSWLCCLTEWERLSLKNTRKLRRFCVLILSARFARCIRRRRPPRQLRLKRGLRLWNTVGSAGHSISKKLIKTFVFLRIRYSAKTKSPPIIPLQKPQFRSKRWKRKSKDRANRRILCQNTAL